MFEKIYFMRKKIYLLFITPFLFILSFAQIQKNELYASLSIGTRVIGYTSNSIRPDISIGLGKHSTVGVFFDYTKYRSWTFNNTTGRSNSFSIGLSYNYYSYFKNSKKWGWSINSTLSLNRINFYEKTGSMTDYTRYTETDLSVTPGIFYRPSPRILLHANIGGFSLYKNRYESMHNIDTRSGFGTQLNIGATISLGNLGKKKKR